MTFNKIVVVDKTWLQDWALKELESYTDHGVTYYNDNPRSDKELLDRIGDAECILVSWSSEITKSIIEKCPRLKYIGMCCSLYDEASANVDIEYARQKNIKVKGIRDYGDEGLIEYILSELIRLIKGMGDSMWKDMPVELINRKLGVIGFGATGRMLAARAKAFQMDVRYFDHGRDVLEEENGIKYQELEDLLQECEIISLHLPKNTSILEDKHFEILGSGKILINTSLGLTFNKNAFLQWVQNPGNYAILDGVGVGDCFEEFNDFKNIIATEIVGGGTWEATERLSSKVLSNIKIYKAQVTKESNQRSVSN